MCTKKEVIVFLAGAEAFHTFAHLLLYAYNMTIALPFITLTPRLNLMAFLVNLLIATGLLYWASKN